MGDRTLRNTIQASQEFTDSLTISESALIEKSRALAMCIKNNHHKPIKAIVAVTRGGLSVAQYVATELNVRFVDTVGVKNYDDNDNLLPEPIIFKMPAEELLGEGSVGVIIIDDLVDSGRTADAIRGIMQHSLLGVIHAKPNGKDRADFYVDDVPQTTWVNYPRDTMLQRK